MPSFGSEVFALALFPFFCSLANIILIYKISAELFNPKVAIISALLLTFLPLEIYYTTSVYPTVPLETTCGLTIYMLLKANNTGKRVYYILAGIFLGIAYLTHITGLFVLLFVSLFLLIIVKRPKLKTISYILSGLLLIFVLECTFYWYHSHGHGCLLKAGCNLV